MHLFCTYNNWASLGYHVLSSICDHKLLHIQLRTCTVCGNMQHKRTCIQEIDAASYLDDMRTVAVKLNENIKKIQFIER